MIPIVLHVDQFMNPNEVVCGVHRAPMNLPNAGRRWAFQIGDLVSEDGPGAIRRIGEELAERLRQNGTVCEVLDYALRMPANSRSLPICFRVSDATAHALSWEALVGNDAFVALDRRWPIVRIARGGDLPAMAQRSFAPPLKFAAVLSAVQSTAIDEWVGLREAVTAARAEGLDVQLTVFAGEEEVIDAVRDTGEAHFVAHPVPGTAFALLGALRGLGPHLLHLYCHGAIAPGAHLLQIGTINDFDEELDNRKGSVVLRAEELGDEMANTRTWAVVLNACSGAEVEGESLTHAEEIVNRGVPVALGMRRLVDAGDASAFSAAFYPEVFAEVQRAASAPEGEERTLAWADTLIRARRALRDKHNANPSRDDAWTVPVLYTLDGPFELIPTVMGGAGATTRAIGESETVGGIIDTLASSAPPGLLDDLRDLMPPPL